MTLPRPAGYSGTVLATTLGITASKVPTDVTEDTIREPALPLGFVDVKVCAVDEVWSGLELAVRKEFRQTGRPR